MKGFVRKVSEENTFHNPDGIAIDIDLNLDLAYLLDYKLKPKPGKPLRFGLYSELLLDFSLSHTLALASLQTHLIDLPLVLTTSLRDVANCINKEEVKFASEIQKLYRWLPKLEVDPDVRKQWWNENGGLFTEQLRQVSIQYRTIGKDLSLSNIQNLNFQKYYVANKLLVDCLKIANVSQDVRQKIEDELLLPIAEIERRKTMINSKEK